MWKEVEFLEAVEAYHNGQKIQCRLDNYIFTYIPDDDTECKDLGFTLADSDYTYSVTTVEILEGQWFILESNILESESNE